MLARSPKSSVCALVLLSAFCVIGSAEAPIAAARQDVPIPLHGAVHGHTYAQWLVASWRSTFANVRWRRHAAPPVETCAVRRLSPNVGTLQLDEFTPEPSSAQIRCRAERGHYLFLSGPTDVCTSASGAGWSARTDAGLKKCAMRHWRSIRPRALVYLDGKELARPTRPVGTPAFPFTMPRRENYLGASGATHGRGAAVGEGLLLKPLKPGVHTLFDQVESHFLGHTYWTTAEYTLTVP